MEFYQFPKDLFKPKYKNLTNDAKIMYILMLNRMIAEDSFDEDGNYYATFYNSELASLLNCSNGKVARTKENLINNNLLDQKRDRVNQPYKYYIKHP